MRSIDELIADHRPGYSLAQRFYTDDELYERELERVINRNWIMAGHVSELAQEGDFKLFEVGRESAIIVRGKDGAISAFANVCRHRGSVVCLEARGNTQQFTCPYHGWKYGLDGRLLAARAMPDSFDAESHGLKRLSLELMHGLILLSFSEAPPSLTNCRKDMAEPMALFDIAGLKVAAQKDYLIPANWKLCIENYQECYHCATAHPEYARLHTLMLHPEQRPRVQQAMLDKMESCGL
ncbi:MAG: aromatic ring-hydroxylating dioxygenase subunit alpha [Proteobacteria bacterium]|nr:aromatic ring-hydroxylating dioxygenase subunit alpha [Pseudomonadota bacterium]